jgi:hypothetical protein
MSKCRSCKAPIEWGVTDAGAMMPLDLEPDKAGNVAVVGRTAGGDPLVLVLGAERLGRAREHGRVELRVCHFQTCPYAGEHRRRG